MDVRVYFLKLYSTAVIGSNCEFVYIIYTYIGMVDYVCGANKLKICLNIYILITINLAMSVILGFI